MVGGVPNFVSPQNAYVTTSKAYWVNVFEGVQ